MSDIETETQPDAPADPSEETQPDAPADPSEEAERSFEQHDPAPPSEVGVDTPAEETTEGQ